MFNPVITIAREYASGGRHIGKQLAKEMGINYYDLGYQAGEMAIRVLLEGADISTMPVEHQTEYEYTFNLDTAEAIGLTIPEDLLALAGE